MRDLHVRLLALVLTIAGVGLTAYKVERLGLPLEPGVDTPVWTVEARVTLVAGGSSVKAELTIPENPPGFWIIDEDYISSNFGLATEIEDGNRQAEWAVRRASGKQTLYYRITLYQDGGANRERTLPVPDFPKRPQYEEPQRGAIEALLDEVRAESADIASFSRELLLRLANDRTDENVDLLREQADDADEWTVLVTKILAGARIPTRIVWGLPLSEGMRHGELEPWLEVHDGDRWLAFNPRTGKRGFPKDLLIWSIGDREILDLKGAKKANVDFSAASRVSDLVTVAEKRAKVLGSRVMDFSLFSLPVAIQNTYRVLLTVPLGIALLVLLRNVVGLRSFGTFMPILIALAFRETSLIIGVSLLVLVVALGLLLRFYLETLKLLLVPRLASVVIIVILLMVGISIFSHRLGLEQGLSISLFPMVILAMTIERMSIVWEELGPREAILQGLGSLFSACVAYGVMSNERLQYLVFVFPELLLVLLALTLLMGRYKGYRLAELWRFRSAIFGRG